MALVAIVALIVLMIWRTISPAAPGINLGYYEVVGKYAGGKYAKRIKGMLVDSTRLFINPDMEPEFKRALVRSIDIIAKKSNLDEAHLKEIKDFKDKLSQEKLSDLVRIIVTREMLFSKHVLVQWHYVKSPLTEFAAHEEGSKFSLSVGPTSQGIITGHMTTLPTRWELPRLGKCTVHMFKPDPLKTSEETTEAPSYLAQLALFAPALVETEELLKSKDDQLKEKDRVAGELRKQLSAKTVAEDAAKSAMSAFSPSGQPVESLIPKRIDVVDIISLLLPTILGYYGTVQAKVEPTLGVILGLLIGIYFVYRRH